MYFDFDDYHPDISPVGRAISWREGILISIIVHLVMIIFVLLFPRLFPYDAAAARARALLLQPPKEDTTFVFVQPRLDRRALTAPDRAAPSDMDRQAQSRVKPQKPDNPLPYNRGNSPELVDVEAQRQQAARGQGPQPDPAAGQTMNQAPTQPDATKLPDSQSAMQFPSNRAPQNGAGGRSATAGGSLGDALRNLQKYTQGEAFDNQGGGGGQFGPEIQFDTKGVEFGPWIRRFIAQVKRNWFIPYAAMSMRGHVVVTFNVHKDGSISDLNVVGPCPVDAFNNAAFGALAGSNPTQPLPPEYPAEKAFFTVTFFYNEVPPR
ncbi:MAG TPA: TonB family protein [Vicinamibacterales bacterium]|jgi:TonB family protein|nr:TonB family protein [Vicinamibacterales bacterium]